MRLALFLCVIVGLALVGCVAPEGSASGPTDRPTPQVAPTSEEPPPAGRAPSPRSPSPQSPSPRAPSPPGPAAIVVRSVGELPEGLLPSLRRLHGVAAVAPVRSGAVLLTGSSDARGKPVEDPAPGWGIPIEAVAVDPRAYRAALPPEARDAFARLRPGSVLLGKTSARLRGLRTGGSMSFGGTDVTVAGVVDDTLVGTAEVIVHHADAAAVGVGGVRYALLRIGGAPTRVRTRVEHVVGGVPEVLARFLGRPPWRASWREVLPQAVVKERFGEFAIRPGAGRAMSQEPGWADAHIVTRSVPVLGEVACHREMLPSLTAALRELERRGLAHLVDPGDYAGCFSPRLIGPGAAPSRHAWGLAVDLNASSNPFGAASAQDPRLVEVIGRHGFGFGGRWPVPDPMHFEYRGR